MRKMYYAAVSASQFTCFFVFLVCATFVASGQNSVNYTPSTGNTASLALDMNSNAIDMSTGTTQLVGSATDDGASAVSPIGFSFIFMGTAYTQFSANTNGYFQFGGSVIVGTTRTFTAGVDLLAPFGEDIETDATGKVHYKLVGTAPNRCLVVEWLNMRINYISATPNATFQMRIYESTGVIEYVYGNMNVASAFSNLTPSGARIGFSKGAVSATNTFTVVTPSTYQQPATLAAGNVNNYPVGVITDLHSTANGSRVFYRFTPVIPSSPTNLTFSAVGTGTMTLDWVDAPNELGYQIYRSTDNINFSLVGQVGADVVSSVQTGLSASTLYYWRVYSFSEGAISSPPLSGSQSTPACGGLAGGTYSVGPTGTYPTITAALTAAGAGVTGPVLFELQSTYASGAETFPITFATNPCITSTNNITIRPATGASALEISSSDDNATIDFNGGTYITIDGRPGGVGTTSQLSIVNSSNIGVAVRFANDAQNNTIKYCDIQGQNTNAPASGTLRRAGVVYFSTGIGAGNDKNTIDNCKIHGTPGNTPTIGVLAIGSTSSVGAYNDSCVISNSHIYDYFRPDSATTGIKIDVGNNAWTISNNHFYQTQPLTYTLNATHRALWVTPNTGSISNTASGFIITGNRIGGSDVNAGGAPYTIGGTTANVFNGMDLSVGLGDPTSVQDNVVANISLTTSSTGNAFVGIGTANGNNNIGTITGNTIGSLTGTANIVVNGTGNAASVFGIRIGGGNATNVANNKIGSIDALGSGAISINVIGIGTGGGTTTHVTGNRVGGDDAYSIRAGGSTNTTAQSVTGINIVNGTTTSVSGNIIQNLTNEYNSTGAGITRGIVVTTSASAITNNTVRNIYTTSPTAGSGASSAIVGIAMTSTNVAGCNVTGNTIDSLVLGSSNTTAAMQVTGIFYSGTTSVNNMITKNFIHSFDLVTSNPNVLFTGIDNAAGTSTFANNMIRLGVKPDGTDLSNDNVIRGISSNSGSATNVYHNSIYIGGANVGSTAKNTLAFTRTSTSGTYDIRNNIFVNNRSNASSGGGKHYVFVFAAPTTGSPTAGVTINNNLYQYTGIDGTFAGYTGTAAPADVTVYAAGWLASDVGSIVGDPQFINPTGTASAVNLHIHATNPTPIEGAGVLIASVTDDYDSQVRSGLTPTDIGADAGNFVMLDIAPPAITYTPLSNNICLEAPSLSATITDGNGVNTTAGTKPRLWFKKATENDVLPATNTSASNGWKWVEASNATSPFTFTIDYSLLTTPVVRGDSISYFVVAQDIATIPNVGANTVTFSSTQSSVALSAGAFPTSGNIKGFRLLDNPIVVKADKVSLCQSGTVTLSLDNTDASGATLQWQSSPAGTNTWSDISLATTAPFTTGTISSSTDFRLVVSCNGTAIPLMSPSNVVTVTVDNPQITGTTPATRCGPGTVNLAATAPGSDIKWYAAASGGNPIGTGSPFTTPVINTNTTYYAAAATPGAGTYAVGAGSTTSATYSNPFYSLWSNTHNQHLIQASELTAAGLVAGNINSLGIDITAAGTLPMIDLSVKIAHTSASDLTNYVTPTFQTVYTSPSLMPVTGLNTLTFTAPFNWDGVSNIVIEICHGNPSSTATMSRTALTDPTSFISTIHTHRTTGTGGTTQCTDNTTNKTTYSVRPKFTFNTGCIGARTAVLATVNTPPALSSVTATPASICEGQNTNLQVTSTNAGYTYTWTPGGAGASISASPTTTTKFYVDAIDNSGGAFAGCSNRDSVTVTVNAVPSAVTVLPATNTICPGSDAIQLTVTGGTLENTLTFGTQASTNAASTSATGYPGPFTNYYGGNRHQFIILASELTSAGFSAGSDITSINFPVVSVGSNVTSLQNFKVKVGHTASGTIAAFVAGLATHYGPASFVPTVGYNNQLVFTAPFTWNGTDNLLIETTYSNGNIGGTADLVAMYNSPTGFQSTIVYKADGQTAAAVEAATTVSHSYSARPDFMLTGLKATTIAWAPLTGLFTDAGATVAYTGTAATSVYAKPASTTVYTATATSAANCTSTGNVTVTYNTSQANSMLAGTAGGAQVCANYDVAVSNNYFNNCNLVARIVPAGASPVSGVINACVSIDASVQLTSLGEPYVQRHYNITPATNAATATSTLTLYFLQSEFNAYNAANGGFPDLPANSTDAAGIGNLRITQFNGAGTTPGTYPAGSGSMINPVDGDIIYNATANRWEVTFSATGSGGFYVHTGNFVLPVTLVEFTGKQVGDINRLSWKTSTETNNRGFELQRSADGNNFTGITFIASKAENGNSTTAITYGYDDVKPIQGGNYYRLKQVDKDGRVAYCNIILLSRKVTEVTLSSVYPNPTPGDLNLVITSPKAEKVTIIVTDLRGKVVMQRATQLVTGENLQTLNVQGLAAGTYFIKAICADGCETAVHRFIKQ